MDSGGLYLGSPRWRLIIFEGRVKPTGVADRLDIGCEENGTVKDNCKVWASANRWYHFT